MIGVDLVYIPEFTARLQAGGNHLLETLFTLDELRSNTPEHLSGVWAAKEAVRKTTDDAPKVWTDIHILYAPSGRPSALWDNRQFAVSISHQGEYAIAIAEEQKETQP